MRLRMTKASTSQGQLCHSQKTPPLRVPGKAGCCEVLRPAGCVVVHVKAINITTALRKEIELFLSLAAPFMDYDLGYIDLEEKTLQPLNNPFGPKVYLCLRYDSVTRVSGPDNIAHGAAGGIRTHDIQNHNLALLPAELQPPWAYSVYHCRLREPGSRIIVKWSGDEHRYNRRRIAGLAFAMNLHRRGLACRVYESAPEMKPLGVGITLLPHAMREFSALGLEAGLREVAIENRESVFFDRYGQFIYREPRGKFAGYQYPEAGIHRGKLHMILFAAAREEIGSENIATNHHCTGVEQDDHGVTVFFQEFGTGRRARASARRHRGGL